MLEIAQKILQDPGRGPDNVQVEAINVKVRTAAVDNNLYYDTTYFQQLLVLLL